MKRSLPPIVKRLSAVKQRRLDALLDKNSEGKLAPREKAELERLVAEAERLMVANAKRLVAFADDERTTSPTAPVPVTVWVKPEHVES
jgi:hypothetical protein